jgi:hypothetical protein
VGELPTIASLDELAERARGRDDLYVRWSRGPQDDADRRSRDELTGVELPGLSASSLAAEEWWSGPDRLWVARRLYDYRHLEHRRRGARPWLVSGRLCGRGPDNEPLITDVEVVAVISPQVVEEATRTVEAMPGEWGPLDRSEEGSPGGWSPEPASRLERWTSTS